ncbi:hypothetical protein DPMN_167595 [Dreissena polymorpha]|uniref:Uncharacterized protein n=1 Tax=Dreissena polymorpha TaxID=45954 RepID=A0A9D4F3K5_DREPO|nr:hypothetical protein DPMN_167595 [Dreissena polymorpha]
MRPIIRPNGMMVSISYANSVRKETGQKSPTPMRMKMKEHSPTLTNNRWATQFTRTLH